MAMDAHAKFALQGFPAVADREQCRRPSWTASCIDDVKNSGVVTGLVQIKLWEIAPDAGVSSGVSNRAVKSLSASLARNSATAVIESSAEDAALVRCASELGAGCTRMEFGGLAPTYRLPVSAVAKYVPLSSRKSTSTWRYKPPPLCMSELFWCLVGGQERSHWRTVAVCLAFFLMIPPSLGIFIICIDSDGLPYCWIWWQRL